MNPKDEAGSILTIDDLAEYLKIPKSTLYKLAQTGQVPGQKVGRHWRFRREAIDRWLDATQPEAEPPSRSATPTPSGPNAPEGSRGSGSDLEVPEHPGAPRSRPEQRMRRPADAKVKGVEDIAPGDARRSAITSHSIGIAELSRLLDAVPPDADPDAYERAAIDDNVLGLATATGRRKRFSSLRRLYVLRPDSIVFRALRDLWMVDEEARPLLAVLCAIATDSVFRASGSVVLATHPGDQVTVADFLESVEDAFPGVYAGSTLQKAADNAYASWQQGGHLGPAQGGRKRRQRPVCRPADVAYALLLGHLQGKRGEALFETLWVRVLDQPRSQLFDLAFSASQRGMLEYRNAGEVVEVGFRELLRPLEGELL